MSGVEFVLLEDLELSGGMGVVADRSGEEDRRRGTVGGRSGRANRLFMPWTPAGTQAPAAPDRGHRLVRALAAARLEQFRACDRLALPGAAWACRKIRS